MRSYNFEPLWRSTIGFDRLFDLAEAAAQHAGEDHYPPYNIERLGEDHYQISLALAGFSPDEISVTAEQNVVTVEGDKAEKTKEQPKKEACGTTAKAKEQPNQDTTKKPEKVSQK